LIPKTSLGWILRRKLGLIYLRPVIINLMDYDLLRLRIYKELANKMRKLLILYVKKKEN
jgi:hypothetical protein